MDYRKADLNAIIAHAKKNDNVDTLKALAAKQVKGNDGKKRNISFIELKKEYFQLFMPEDLPVAKKKQSMYDIINNL